MKEDDCNGEYPCPCYRKTKCQLAGFEKVVELKNAGLSIYRHSSQFGDKDSKHPRKDDEENVFIFHNTKDADIQSADFLPEMEKRAIKCPRCRRIMDHALNVLQKVSAICKNEVIGICDHCKLKQQPCCECVGAIRKFFDVKKDAKPMLLSKKRLSEFLSKVQNEVKNYFGDVKRGRTEILKDYIVEKDTDGKLRAKSDEHIDQLCRWKYVRGGRELNIKDLYRESERKGLIKPTTDPDRAKKHIAFKEDREIIHEPSTSMFSIERKAKSAFLESKLKHDGGYIKPTIPTIDEKEILEKIVDKKSELLLTGKVQHFVDKPVIESEQKNLDGAEITAEKDYFKIVEKKSGTIKKDFIFSFPRDKKEIKDEKRQISSTELIHDVNYKIREKSEEKKRMEEETRRRKLEEEEEKRQAALKEKELREKARQDQIEGETRSQQPDYRSYGKSQIKAIGSKESKSVPEMKESIKPSDSKLKSKSAISKESRPEEARGEGKDIKSLKPDHKQSKAETETVSKQSKGEAKQLKDDSKAASKQIKGELKDDTKQSRGEPKQAKDDSKQPKGEPKQTRDDVKGETKQTKPPKIEPKKESKEPKSETKRDSKQLKTESKQPKVDSKVTKTETLASKEPKQPKLDSKEPKPPKLDSKEPKPSKLDSKESKPPKIDSKEPKPKPPKVEAKGEVKQTKREAKESKPEPKQKGEPKVTKPESKEEPKPPKPPKPGDSKGVKSDKEVKTDQKDTKKSKGDTRETKGDSKEAKAGKKETGDKGDAKETKGDSKETKGDSKETKGGKKEKGDTKEIKSDSKEPKGGKKEPGDALDWKKFVGTPKPPPKPAPPPKQTKEKESKLEAKEPKSDAKEPKSDAKESKSATKGSKSGTKESADTSKAKRDDKKAGEKEPTRVPKTTKTIRDSEEPKEKEVIEADMKKIEKELPEKLKAEKPPPPKIEEEPIIKYGKDIKLRSPDEPRVPRRQIEAPPTPPPKKKVKKELKVKHISMLQPSQNLLALQMVKVKGGKIKDRTLSQLMTQSEIFVHLGDHKALKGERCPMCINSQLELEYESRQRQKAEMQEIIDGRNIKFVAGHDKSRDREPIKPLLYQLKYNDQFKADIIQAAKETPIQVRQFDTPQKPVKTMPEDESKGVIKYALSDRSFIEKGWTRLPTEKVVRKMNVYRMRPAHPEFDWFKRNKGKRFMTYDSGERLAEFDDDGRGRWYYKNQRMALQYYDAEELNAQQRFVIFSNGEPDERGRARPYTILATFDYLGNGVVFDHGGKIRMKYNQTEGVVLDRSIGPATHWKWHSLNDPPVLQQVMIDTQMTHKDPEILKMGAPNENLPRPDNEDMLAIEFDNFIKEKSQKLKQTFKPFQIKMKAMKINEHFSLKVLDQANVHLIYRDGTTNIKLNLGMVLDHKEIVDTDSAEVGEVSNNMERFPAKTDSLAAMQKSVAYAKHFERSRTERERRLRPAQPSASADKLTAATCKPLKPPLISAHCSSTTVSAKPLPKVKSRKPSSSNVYYDSRLL